MPPVNAPPRVTRQYPHVDGVTDWRAQQTIRLLWDRVWDLEGRLQDAETQLGGLATTTQAQQDAITEVRRAAGEALALAQQTARQAGGGGGGGTPAIPDYSAIVASTLSTHFVSPIVPIADRETGKAQLTRAAAWAIYQVDPNIRLFQKTSGTNVNGRSTDLVVYAIDGSYADVVSDPGTVGDPTTVTITATWGANAADANTSDSSRWIVPTSTIAAEAGPMTYIP